MTDHTSASRNRILLVDDHAIVRHGIKALLADNSEFEICGEAGSYEEALQACDALCPDLVILDITLRDRSGLDLIGPARRINSAVKVLVLSMHDEADYAARAIRAGARGYVMKEQADEVLVDALRAVVRGGIYVSPAIAAHMLRETVDGGAASKPATGIEALTERERQVLEGIGRGLTSRAIAAEFGLSDRTVEVHRAHIKKKLQCESAAQVVREAVRWIEQGIN